MIRKIGIALLLALLDAGLFPVPASGHDEPRMTPLMEAAYRGDIAAVRALVESGVDVNQRSNYGATALMMAAGAGIVTPPAHQGSTEVLEYLIDHGADVNAVGGNDTTALRYAVMHGNRTSVNILLDHGADIDAGRGSGQTALAEAVLRSNVELVMLLLGRGAAVNGYVDINGRTPLMNAVAQVQPLPADLNAQSSTLEILAAGMPLIVQNQIVDLLLQHGAAIAGVDRNGETVLTLAAGRGRTSIVKALLGHGAPVNEPNRQGLTALMIAAQWGNATLVKFLVQSGADPAHKDRNGDTALDLARRGHHAEVANLLEAAERH